MGRKRGKRRTKKEQANQSQNHQNPKESEHIIKPNRISDLQEPIIHHVLSFLPAKDVVKTSVLSSEQIIKLDRISDLPEPIIHHVLSFLPAKDVIKTCVLSKRWRNLWCYVPVLDFSSSSQWFYKTGWRNQFVEFVDRFIQRCETSPGIDKFKLNMNFLSASSVPHVDDWVSFAIKKNVKELDLLFNKIQVSDVSYTLLPTSLVSSTLTALKLSGCRFGSTDQLYLPCLRDLSLESVRLNDETLNDLVFRCPTENLCMVSCYGLMVVRISSSTLQSIDASHCSFEEIEVEAPSLRSFRYNANNLIPWFDSTLYHNLVDIKIASCNALTVLSLEGISFTDQELEMLISNFPLLENLILIGCNSSTHVKFFGPSLKRLTMNSCYNLYDAEITATNLLWFSYTGEPIAISFTTPLVTFEAMLSLKCQASTGSGWQETEWYLKLHRFLGSFNHAKAVTLSCTDWDLIFPPRMKACLISPLYRLKLLKVNLPSLSKSKFELLNGLLWLCPRLEILSVKVESTGESFQLSAPRLYRSLYGNLIVTAEGVV